MKKIVLLLITFFLVTLYAISQSISDQAKILKKCIDLPEIQKYFPVDASSNPLQVIIIERHPSKLRSDLNVKKFGMDLKYIYESDIPSVDPPLYLMFRDFEITDITGNISYEIHFGSGLSEKTIIVNLVIRKDNQDWTVINKDVK